MSGSRRTPLARPGMLPVSPRAIGHGILVFVLDALCLFWVAEAARQDAVGWSPDRADLLRPLGGDWGQLGWLAGAFAVELGFAIML